VTPKGIPLGLLALSISRLKRSSSSILLVSRRLPPRPDRGPRINHGGLRGWRARSWLGNPPAASLAVSRRKTVGGLDACNADKLPRTTPRGPLGTRGSGALRVVCRPPTAPVWEPEIVGPAPLPPLPWGGRPASATRGGPTRKTRGRHARGRPSLRRGQDSYRPGTAGSHPGRRLLSTLPVTATPWHPCARPRAGLRGAPGGGRPTAPSTTGAAPRCVGRSLPALGALPCDGAGHSAPALGLGNWECPPH
jgi:hypothetical protein